MRRIPAAIRIRYFSDESKVRLGALAPLFTREGQDLVFYSKLTEGTTSEQLVWLFGLVQHDAKILKKIREESFDIIVDIQTADSSLTLEPASLLLAHKLGIPTEIRLTRKKSNQPPQTRATSGPI